LRFDAASELLVEALNRVGRSQRLPLGLGEGEEREQLVAALAQTGHDAWAALGPRTLESRVGDTRGVATGCVDDTVEVVTDLGQRVPWGFAFEVAQFVDAAALDHGPGPHEADGSARPGIAVDNR